VIVERGALDSDDLSAAARPTIVDQAIAEAEALQRDETATRFRGVDDEQ
jgi:hypothetical protein